MFPSLILTDVYYIQKNTTDNTLGLEKFTDSIFNPENNININRDNIVWTTKLREDSQVVKAIKQGVTTTTDQTQTQIKTTESK